MLTQQYIKAYLHSLTNSFCSFYDNIQEYGNPSSKNCIYFIPGINGSPGQIRFALPAASRYFGDDLYIKGLFTQEFSCHHPVWEKYSVPNVEKKVAKIVADLTDLTARYGRVTVFCSSNGFYDFYAATSRLDNNTLAALTLFWIACAPDKYEDTRWEKLFFKLNGFMHNDHRWAALPNNNYLRWLNPEIPYKHRCNTERPNKYFYKHDIESRFYIYRSLWSYFSIGAFNQCLSYLTSQASGKLALPTYVLAAQYDGYWQGKDMRKIIDDFVENPVVLMKPTSHLWIAAPEYVYEILQTAFG